MAKRLDPSKTLVSEAMTPHPTMVHMNDSALDCLGIMIEKHFRHLPVSEQKRVNLTYYHVVVCFCAHVDMMGYDLTST